MEKIIRYLKRLCKEGFYGTLELRFENGKITNLRKMNNIKPEELPN